MSMHTKFQGPALCVMVVLSLLAPKDASGQEIKASGATTKYVRSLDPAGPQGLFKLLATAATASSANFVEVTGCSGDKALLARDKMIETEEQCSNGGITGPWSYVVLGSVNSVQADTVTLDFETTNPAGGKKTLTIPKTFLSKTGDVRKGSSVIFYHADLKAGLEQHRVVSDFKAFENMVKANPSNAFKDAKFKVQVQW